MIIEPVAVRDPREAYGLNDHDLQTFRKDPELIEAVEKFTGRQYPMSDIDDALIAEIAGAVQKLGVDDAVKEFKRIMPRKLIVLIRAICIKRRIPLAGR